MARWFWAGLLLIAQCLCPSDIRAQAPARPQFTNKSRFRIPFDLEPREMQRLGAREIRLYVSTDQGLRWVPVQSLPPQAGKFSFQAPQDGEYWFCVRTLDARGQLHPADDALQPGLQVVVDSLQPRLELSLRQIAPGRVQMNWQAIDEHLDSSKLRLEYIQPGQNQWQTIGIVPKAADSTAWNVPQGGVVAVRGSVMDFAGNSSTNEARTQVAPGNGPGGAPGVPDFRDPIAGADPLPPETAQNSAAPQFPSAIRTPPGFPTPAQSPAPWPNQAPLSQPALFGNTSPRGMGLQGGLASLPNQGNTFQDQPSAPQFPGTMPAANRDPTLRIVNQRQFQIGYRIEEVGPSGVSSVDLFITQDNGASWFRYGEDPDRQSPFVVSVPKEGQYGFTLLVRSGVGVSVDPPQPGERPSFSVQVDETAPQLQLLPPEQGRGPNLNKLLLRWVAQDEHLADKPISLWCAASTQGPWQPLATDLENSGYHVWQMGPGVPLKLYFRIEARDAAGNVQRVDTNEPALIDLTRPTARIVDVETTATNAPSFFPQR